MHCYQEKESTQHRSRNKLNNFYEADNRRDLHRTPLGENMIPLERSGVSTPRPPFSSPGACRANGFSSSQPTATLRPSSRGAIVQENDTHLNSSYAYLGASGKHLLIRGGERPSSTFAMSSTNSRQLFSPGEIEECDKYNPLILHHAEIQSRLQHRETRVPLGKAYPLPGANEAKYVHHGVGHSPEPRPYRHNLLYDGGLCETTGKLGVLKPKANSAASTTMSTALAHTIISPSASCSDATSTSFSPASTTFAKDLNTNQVPKHETECMRNSSSRRMSLPEPPPMDRNLTRRMSYTVTSPPKLLDTLFQRVWNPQQSSPGTNSSPLALTNDDVETPGMTHSQLVTHRSKQNWDPGEELASSTNSIPIRYPSTTSFTGNGSPCLSSPRREIHCAEGRQAQRFKERFIQQVTFSLDETHKSGLQAILALRKLTNGLTSAHITPLPRVNGGRFAYPNIPIPKISHRYPSTSNTVIVNGQPRVLNKKNIPSVVIDWSDGIRDEFDPTGMSLEEILGRCHYSSTS